MWSHKAASTVLKYLQNSFDFIYFYFKSNLKNFFPVLRNETVVSKQENDELKYSTPHENAWFTPCNICAEIKENSTFELCQVRNDHLKKKLIWEKRLRHGLGLSQI